METNKRTSGQEIILGVTGSIAAYKAAEIVSELRKKGFSVTVALTPSATKFITALTFKTLTGRRVYDSVFAELPGVGHIELTESADLLLIAPASANFLAKAASGLADDPVSLLYLACKCPVVIAPAMNERMLTHPAVQRNIAKLMEDGAVFVQPEEGKLACGIIGKGRLASASKIVAEVEKTLSKSFSLRGKTVLITAGPTREPIDEVRFISNYSSGKTGYAIAAEALRRGAKVELVSGPTGLNPPPGVKTTFVNSAAEMHQACLKLFPQADILIMAAAVADYRPQRVVEGKIKKDRKLLDLKLVENPDILKELTKLRRKNQLVIGFVAETENLTASAKLKLKDKKLDLVVANLVGQGKGFETDFNKVTLFFKNGKQIELPLMSKVQIARELFDRIEGLIEQKRLED